MSDSAFRPEVEIVSTVDDVTESATMRGDRSQRMTTTGKTTMMMMTMMVMMMVVVMVPTDIKCYTCSNVCVLLSVRMYFSSAS